MARWAVARTRLHVISPATLAYLVPSESARNSMDSQSIRRDPVGAAPTRLVCVLARSADAFGAATPAVVTRRGLRAGDRAAPPRRTPISGKRGGEDDSSVRPCTVSSKVSGVVSRVCPGAVAGVLRGAPSLSRPCSWEPSPGRRRNEGAGGNRTQTLVRALSARRPHRGRRRIGSTAPPHGVVLGDHQVVPRASCARARAASRTISISCVRELSPEGAFVGVSDIYEPDAHAERGRGHALVDGQLAAYTAVDRRGDDERLRARSVARARARGRDHPTRSRRRSRSPTGRKPGSSRRLAPRMDVRSLALVGRTSRSEQRDIDIVADGRRSVLPREGQDALVGAELVRPHRTARRAPRQPRHLGRRSRAQPLLVRRRSHAERSRRRPSRRPT